MNREDEFLLQLIDRVSVASQSFDSYIDVFCQDEKQFNGSNFLTKEIELKIRLISDNINELYQLIGNIR